MFLQFRKNRDSWIRRKVEDYEEIEENEQTETRGKYVVEWHPAGEGKIKDGLAGR